MSDYMQEVGRMADDYAQAVHDGRDEDCQKLRAALLAHIERGRVPEGWKPMPPEATDVMLDAAARASMQHMLDCINDPELSKKVGSEEMVRLTHASRYRSMFAAAPAAPDHSGAQKHLDPDVSRILADNMHKMYECASPDHSATVPECMVPPLGWRCTRGAGHAGPCAAVEYPDDVRLVEKGMQRLRATVPAEVPMPESVGGTFIDGLYYHKLYSRSLMQEYGAAREAAGYARGLAAKGGA